MIFCGSHNYEAILSMYVSLDILPDFDVPGIEEGKAVDGMPANFHGGPLPPELR